METIKKLEDQIEKILKPLPHLPADGRKWLSENLWWLTIVGVVIDAGVLLGIYRTATYVNTITNYLAAYGISSASGWTASLTISLILLAISAVLMLLAVNPLKEQKKQGWDLLFYAAIIGVASSVVTAVLDFSFGDIVSRLIGAAFGAAVSAYFLFEIRSNFNSVKVLKKKQ